MNLEMLLTKADAVREIYLAEEGSLYLYCSQTGAVVGCNKLGAYIWFLLERQQNLQSMHEELLQVCPSDHSKPRVWNDLQTFIAKLLGANMVQVINPFPEVWRSKWTSFPEIEPIWGDRVALVEPVTARVENLNKNGLLIWLMCNGRNTGSQILSAQYELYPAETLDHLASDTGQCLFALQTHSFIYIN